MYRVTPRDLLALFSPPRIAASPLLRVRSLQFPLFPPFLCLYSSVLVPRRVFRFFFLSIFFCPRSAPQERRKRRRVRAREKQRVCISPCKRSPETMLTLVPSLSTLSRSRPFPRRKFAFIMRVIHGIRLHTFIRGDVVIRLISVKISKSSRDFFALSRSYFLLNSRISYPWLNQNDTSTIRSLSTDSTINYEEF